MFSFYAIFTKKTTYLIPTIMKNILLSALFSLITTLGFSQAPNYVPVNGLVGWWPFNGNADDESGNGNNGTVNGATMTTDRNGVANQAYSFDGIDNYIATNSLLNASEDFSFSCWVNSNNNSNQTILNTIPHTIIFFGINAWWAGAGNIGFLYGTGDSFGWLNNNYYFPNPNLFQGVWVNHLIVKNGLNWKFYQNGVLIHNYNAPSNPASTISQLVFGHCDPSICSATFNGKIDDIGMWNRTLTDCEIQNLYNSSNPTNTTASSACNNYTWNGTTYTTSGVYTGPTANCITESLNLTITPSSTNTISASACGSYVWNGTTYTASGVYTGTTANCVTESLDLTINSLSVISQPQDQSVATSVGLASFTASTSSLTAIYQWQTNLGFGFQNLNNAGQYNGTTSSTLSVINLSMSNNNQVFRCIISSGSCTDTSDLAVLTVVNNAGINDLSASKLSIYPNPTNGDFTITGLEIVGTVSSLTLTDMNGKVVKVLDTKATKFSMTSIKPGVYFLNIRDENKQEVLKIVKE